MQRSNLEAAEAALSATENSLKEKESELKQARLSLTDTTIRLNESERNINHLQENRWGTKEQRNVEIKSNSNPRKSLLQELKAAKEVLISSLKNVHDLELESRKVPKLEAQIHQLENKIARKRSYFYSQQSMIECFQENVPSRYMRVDTENLVLSDSEPEESQLVNQSIEGGSPPLILPLKPDSHPIIVFRPR